MLCIYCNKNPTLLYSNTEISPTYFDHSSLNQEQLWTPTMKYYAKMHLKAKKMSVSMTYHRR